MLMFVLMYFVDYNDSLVHVYLTEHGNILKDHVEISNILRKTIEGY